MPINATDRTSNVIETVRAYLATLTIPGSPDLVRLDGVRPIRSLTAPRLEWQIAREASAPLGGDGAGGRTLGAEALLTIDLRWPAAANGDDATQIVKASEQIVYSFRRWSTWLLDYGAGNTAARLTVLGEPEPSILEPARDQPRRRIRVRLHWLTTSDR